MSVILSGIPGIEEGCYLISTHTGEQPGDRTITFDGHALCKERVPPGVVGVILGGIVLTHDHVGSQIKNKAGISAEGVIK